MSELCPLLLPHNITLHVDYFGMDIIFSMAIIFAWSFLFCVEIFLPFSHTILLCMWIILERRLFQRGDYFCPPFHTILLCIWIILAYFFSTWIFLLLLNILHKKKLILILELHQQQPAGDLQKIKRINKTLVIFLKIASTKPSDVNSMICV